MRRIALCLLLMTVPGSAQDTETHQETHLTQFEVSIASEWMQLSVPFGPTGNVPYSPNTPNLGLRIGNRDWYLDFAAQLLDRSIHQRRIATTMVRSIAHPGRFHIGFQIDYWELGFRRRVATVHETGVETYRQGRTVMAGPSFQTHGPWSTLLGWSVTAGWYKNEYDSVILVDSISLLEPLVRDETGIGKAQVGIQTGLIANRVRLAGSVRHLRILGPRSSWTPATEWSGDARLDIRLFTRRGKSIFIGGYMRFGPPGPGLVSDKTFGLRGTAKLR